ncbi:MAG TPA: phosphohistidine phosphatase SixA [Polyangiaceae bacterium]
MKLYVMRHGPAEDHSESGVDADRALTVAGRERVRAVAEALAEAGEAPLTILTSPLVRAVQTAEIVAMVTGLGKRGGSVEVRRAIAPGGDAARLVHALASEERKRVMVVGHEPDLSGLVASLVGHFGRGFDKAMVVGVHVPNQGGDPTLRFVLDPKTRKLETAGPAGA